MSTADAVSVRLLLRDRLVPLVALVGAGAVVPGVSLHFLGHDSPGHLGTKVHFIGVGLSAVAATFAAFALTLVGVRRKDTRVVLVGTAFTIGVAWLTATLPAALLLDYPGSRLVARPRLRAGGNRDRRRRRRARPQPHRAVAGARRRPARGRPRGGGGGVPRGACPRAHAATARKGRVDRGAHPARRPAAVQVGEELGLAPGRLRALAIGGLLHDMGKLSVPERILKKPGALDEEEFAVIKRHLERGIKLLRGLGGFPSSVLELVHDHHERLDGKGYPRGLAGCDLSLDTRILTVCDVYDALVSPRVYRPAWSHEAAVGLLRQETGAAFDERCVAALEAVLGREQPVTAMPVLRIAAASA